VVEIKFGEKNEAYHLAGQTVSEAREQFKAKFGIPDKARAKLNGRNVKGGQELDTVLSDDDKLSFAVAKGKGAYLVGALLLALALTGGVFAFGFINASTSLNTSVTLNSNIADVTANATGTSAISWPVYGFYKGAITSDYLTHTDNGTPIFNVGTKESGYEGDLVVTVSLGNADTMAKVYRVFAMKLTMETSNNVTIDINEDNQANKNSDWVMLTLENGSVSMFPKGIATGDNMTVRLLGGFYITQIRPFAGWGTGSGSPDLFCEVAQR
jgi:molybdopterin converting factor small subunit